MVKVYKNGVNVCIDGYNGETIYIPTQQTRFEITTNSVVITDLFPYTRDRFSISKTDFSDKLGASFVNDIDIANYLSDFIGKSYCCSDNSIEGPLNQTFTDNSLAAGREVVIDYKTLAGIDVKRQTITYDASNNIISNIFNLPPYGVAT